MSIIDDTLKITLSKQGTPLEPKSKYDPTDEEKEAIFLIKSVFF